MNIALFGPSGTIGSRILKEAVSRGHAVTAFAHHVDRLPQEKNGAEWQVADVLDPKQVASAAEGRDAVISAFGPPRGGDVQTIVTAAHTLLGGVGQHPEVRLLIVGGAGSLEVAPGKTVIDSGVIPNEWIAIPIAHKDALAIYKANTAVSWTYFSPAGSIQPGERTGKFRLGGDQLVVGADGKSTISAEDYAIAMIDEAEKAKHVRQRFTIGY